MDLGILKDCCAGMSQLAYLEISQICKFLEFFRLSLTNVMGLMHFKHFLKHFLGRLCLFILYFLLFFRALSLASVLSLCSSSGQRS